MGGFLLLTLIQLLQERQSAKKIKRQLAALNPILFNPKQLHWEIDTYGSCLILELQYNSSDSGAESSVSALRKSTIDMFFKRTDTMNSGFNLDMTSQSYQQSMIAQSKLSC